MITTKILRPVGATQKLYFTPTLTPAKTLTQVRTPTKLLNVYL